jgi:hypothetical protein
MQNYNLVETDRYVAISGNQNVSFTFQNGTLRQRIDRFWQRSGKDIRITQKASERREDAN